MTAEHCCERMDKAVSYVCEMHPNWQDCPDNLITYDGQWDQYGLIIHNWGIPDLDDDTDEPVAFWPRSYVVIAFCPFCGTRLPESKRDRWEAELEQLGYDFDGDEPLPAAYQTNEWWRHPQAAGRPRCLVGAVREPPTMPARATNSGAPDRHGMMPRPRVAAIQV